MNELADEIERLEKDLQRANAHMAAANRLLAVVSNVAAESSYMSNDISATSAALRNRARDLAMRLHQAISQYKAALGGWTRDD